MKYSFSSLAAVIGIAAAAAVDLNAADIDQGVSPLGISLTPVANTVVKVTVSNKGDKGYNILHRGTILDNIPVNKLRVSKGSSKAQFHGVKLRLATKNLPESSFTALAPGQSKEVLIDLAEIYDLTSGIYDVVGKGHFRYAELNSTELVGSVLPYTSNALAMNIDGVVAAQVTKAIDAVEKRSTIQNDCTAAQKSVVAQSEAKCYNQAVAASKAALSGSATKFQEYFKSTATKDRQYVSKRFDAVAKECNNTPGGVLNVYCTDKYNYCDDGTFAYTVSSDNNVIWCAQYYSHPVETTSCHGDDKAGTTIHEYTHADSVFSPGTDDYAYTYANCVKLSREKALENADTYEYYANAIHLGC